MTYAPFLGGARVSCRDVDSPRSVRLPLSGSDPVRQTRSGRTGPTPIFGAYEPLQTQPLWTQRLCSGAAGSLVRPVKTSQFHPSESKRFPER